jgi:hypothetical protein
VHPAKGGMRFSLECEDWRLRTYVFQKIAKAPQGGISASLRQAFALQKHFFNSSFGLTSENLRIYTQFLVFPIQIQAQMEKPGFIFASFQKKIFV